MPPPHHSSEPKASPKLQASHASSNQRKDGLVLTMPPPWRPLVRQTPADGTARSPRRLFVPTCMLHEPVQHLPVVLCSGLHVACRSSRAGAGAPNRVPECEEFVTRTARWIGQEIVISIHPAQTSTLRLSRTVHVPASTGTPMPTTLVPTNMLIHQYANLTIPHAHSHGGCPSIGTANGTFLER
ncbi:hypothetical protein RJ55_02750 [Drechmeria coniospora]|nr:hypothetical protein RJ55_02750 [Drechmeria coniospora]